MMNNALRGLVVVIATLTLMACGSDADDSAVSNNGSGQTDNGGDTGNGDGGDTGNGDGGDTGNGGGGDTGNGDGGDTGNGGDGDAGNGGGGDGVDNGYSGQPNSTFALLRSRSDMSTLVQAIDAAGLAQTLGEAGSLTLLAPDNIAFDRLFQELNLTPAQLFGNVDLLTEVLRYHVLDGAQNRASIPMGLPLDASQGSVLKFEQDTAAMPTIYDGRGRLSRVKEMDLQTSNGFVHTIYSVLLPADKNIVQLASARGDLSVLAEAITAAGLTETLASPGPLTLLAPDNNAFAAIFSELGLTKEQLFADTELLRSVLTYHVLPGAVFRAQIPFGERVATVQGQPIMVGENYPPLVWDIRGREAEILSIDAITTNGVVHILNRVLLPAN